MTAAGEALLSAEAEKRAAVAREDYAAATKCKLEASRQRYLLCERVCESERECERERECKSERECESERERDR